MTKDRMNGRCPIAVAVVAALLVGGSAVRFAVADSAIAREAAPNTSAAAVPAEILEQAEAAPNAGAAPAVAPAPPLIKKPPVQPWKGVFFDNDFSYKRDPDHDWLLGEGFKDISFPNWLEWIGDPALFSAGGEVRYRMIDEANRLRPVPNGVKNIAVYNQWRYRQYVDLKYGDGARIYAELLDGSMFGNPLPAAGVDLNRWDLQDLFVDLKFAERDDQPVYVRIGRQELLYGSQRLLSPLDWANIRRNFQGIKVFSKGTDWDLDFWVTYPVNIATYGNGQALDLDNSLDSPNVHHTFSGAWWTYKGVKDQTWDVYWFWDWNKEVVAPHFAGGNRHTLATRWLRSFPVADSGDVDRTWLAEVEGGYQFGNDFGRVVNAGFVTSGIGHQWTGLRWQPTVWFYCDWASGSRNYNGSTTQTFSQQYGLTHAYLGQIDNIARQNIRDINGKFSITPLRQFVLETQFHWFDLQNPNDVLYTVTGSPFGNPGTGRHVGQEVDVVGTYTYNQNFSIQLGYFYFWYGNFVQNNSPRGNAYMFYVTPTIRF